MSRDQRTSSVEKTIDENLKRAFEDVASEPLPSRFTDLLDQLKSAAPQSANDAETDGSK